jgi:uncharacterized protein YndB with AHSA1/START domain
MKIESPEGEPVLVLTRRFSAPRALVWKTLTEPAFVKRWYGGHGFSNPKCEMDVRPGGRWSHLMRTPDGNEFPGEYVFLEVAPPERLVWRNADFDAGSGPHCNVMTVTLTDAGDETEWKLVVRFKSMTDRQAARDMQFTHVLSQGCERVEELVRARPGSTRPDARVESGGAPLRGTAPGASPSGAEHH